MAKVTSWANIVDKSTPADHTKNLQRLIIEQHDRVAYEVIEEPCGREYARPKPGEESVCSRPKCTLGHGLYCINHAWEPANWAGMNRKWPKCKNGRNHPSHKHGIHPSVSPKEFHTGLCYFCLKWNELVYQDALASGEDPTGMPVAGASPIEPTAPVETPPAAVAPIMSGDYLARVNRAAFSLGVSIEGLTRGQLDAAYRAVRRSEREDGIPRDFLIDACNCLVGYLETV